MAALDALDLVGRIMSDWPYTRLLALTESVEAALTAGRGAGNALARLRAAYEQYLEEHPGRLESLEHLDLGAVHQLARATDEPLANRCGELKDLLDSALAQAECAEAHLLLQQQDEVGKAVEAIRGLARDVPAGAPVLLRFGEPRQVDGEQRLNLTVRSVLVAEADILDRALLEAAAMMKEVSI